MDEIRHKQKIWLTDVLQRTGMKPSQLAQKAGLSTTTLTRFLNATDHKTALSPQTLNALHNALLALAPSLPDSAVAAVAFPDVAKADETPAVEGDAAPYPAEHIAFEKDAHIRALLETALQNGAERSLWVVKSNALQGRGLLPGDLLCVDASEEPRHGDVLCAQVYDWARMEARTVLRFYSPPYLLANEQGVMHQPLAAKDQHLKIAGVVLFSCRPRRVWG